jgi:D-glycero-D-manno-heptose 1,7-bisphosphate phosphatase
MKKLIILDRDGVINYDSEHYIKTPDEWHAIPGSLDAIAKLNRAGYHVVVATNQSGVARGFYDIPMLHRIHEKLTSELASYGGVIDEIFFCPHHPDEHCACRKPALGMFHQIQDKYGMDLSKVYFIGDSYSDMQVAERLPCKPILVLTSKGEKTLKNHPELLAIPHFVDLATAVNYILKSEQE